MNTEGKDGRCPSSGAGLPGFAPSRDASRPSAAAANAGSLHLGTLAQPMRNGSCDVVMCWEAAELPAKVCEGGGWYSVDQTRRRWLLRTWLQHKGRPGYGWDKCAPERNTDLQTLIAEAAANYSRLYGFDRLASVDERPQGQDAERLGSDRTASAVTGDSPADAQPLVGEAS